MSSEGQPVACARGKILRENAIALLLTKALDIHISHTTSAMIEDFSAIEAYHPDFACRILLVACGRANNNTLNEFLKDFRILGSVRPNIQPLPIDFRYVVKVMDDHVPEVPSVDSLGRAAERKSLMIMLLFILAFGEMDVPSGAYRVNCLELIAALQGSLRTHCLRIVSDVASSEDIRVFETKLQQSRVWRDALVGARAIRAGTPGLGGVTDAASQSSQELNYFEVDEGEEDEYEGGYLSEHELYDLETNDESLGDIAYANIMRNLDHDVFAAIAERAGSGTGPQQTGFGASTGAM